MESTIVLAETDEQKLSLMMDPLVAGSVEYRVIRDDAHGNLATGYVGKLKKAIDMVGLLFDEPTAKANTVHKMLTARRGALLNPLKQARDDVSRSVRAYERKVEEEAQRRRDESLAKARAEAEEKRAAEQKNNDDELQRAEDARVEQALALEAEGHKSAADAVLETPVMTAPPSPEAPVVVDVPPEPVREKPTGVSMRANWKFRITDELIVPREWLIPDMTAIGQFVRGNKGRTSIPGIEVYAE